MKIDWRQLLCEVRFWHKREWRVKDDICVLYCPDCNLILDIKHFQDGKWI